MVKNYLITAIRSLRRNKFFAVLNVLGLALGLTCAILIGSFVRFELSYDRYNQKHDRIYRLESHFNIQGKDDLFAVTSLPLAPALMKEYPEIENFCRFTFSDNNLFKYMENEIFESDVYFADSTVFDLFTLEFIRGSAKGALSRPNTMILTESFAGRLFGNEDPMGKTIEIANGVKFEVTGVIRDLPDNTHLKYQALYSMITLADIYGRDVFFSLEPRLFWNVGFYSFILLRENSSIQNILDNSPNFYEKYMKELGDQLNASFQLMVQPLADVHLKSNLGYDSPSGNMSYIYTFGLIAIFLLLIACINYMNMATSQSAKRALEVGMRKVLGAQRFRIQSQFLVEAVLVAFFALIIAFIAAELLLPVFNQLSGRSLELDFQNNLFYVLVIVIITLCVGLISGSYPSFYLSSHKPMDVMKGDLGGKDKGTLRKILVLVQFTISLVMIIGTFIVVKQIQFFQKKDLGFNKENIITITVRDTTGIRNLDSFKGELEQHSNVISVGRSNSIPGSGYGIIVQRIEADDGSMIEKGVNFVFMDHDYLDTMDMKIIQGRNFDPDLESDLEESILINEAAANIFGWRDQAIGKRIQFGAGTNGSATRDTKVIGVVQDFHYESLHNRIDPILFLISDRPLRTLSIKISDRDVNETLEFIDSKWSEFLPDYPFDYAFLDDNLRQQYIAEEKLGSVFSYFALICIFIACLGLFGLAAHTAEQRKKEIGIRKVMGATTTSINLLLSKEFAKWVLISNIIAWPIAYYLMKEWLNNFAYQIEILPNIGLFFLAGFIAFIIALITVSFQSVKAASTNPAEIIKYE